MGSNRTAAWVLIHSDAKRLSLVSPCQQLILGPYTSICDVEQALARLCRLSSSAAALVTPNLNGRTKVRFSDSMEFTITSEAPAQTIAALLCQAKHSTVDDQRDPRRRRFSISGPVQRFAV